MAPRQPDEELAMSGESAQTMAPTCLEFTVEDQLYHRGQWVLSTCK